tara:strand:- start:1826 stop:3562 length:1737 start_codon:yes stop_codon:yes gene_type:complete
MSNTLLTENIARLWTSVVANQLHKLGTSHVFIAPGMRNAPLIAGFKAQQSIELHVGMDERALAYQAYGYAKTSGKPGVLVCTSGTAAANFYPAVIEAKKSNTPLIVISADRPLELSQTDANQSIDQKQLFSNHIKHFLELGTPSEAVAPKAVARMMAHAYEVAMRAPAGPVHINISFREPLDAKTQPISEAIVAAAKALFDSQTPARQLLGQNTLDISSIMPLLKNAKNPLVVVGELSLSDVSSLRAEVLSALKSCPFPLNVDVTSSLKFDFSLNDGLVPTFDHPEVFEHFHQNPPDLILHIGARLTSKHFYRYLDQHADQFPVIHLSKSVSLSDSGHAVTHNFNVDPINAILALGSFWSEISSTKVLPFTPFVHKKIEIIENAKPLAFPYISKRIVELIPEDHNLVIGNSTLIRSFDSYASQAQAKALNVLTHRGVSGIEGFFASSTGCALANSKPVTLALGDVSALHDLNSLELVARSKTPIICVVVNNYGGGIFTLLNLEKGEELYPIITSPHERKLAPIAKAFGIESHEVNSRSEFEAAYKNALTKNTSSFIEVFVDTLANNEIYQQLRTIKLS